MNLLKKDFIFKDVNKLKGVGPQLSKYLKKKKIPFIVSREPGGTDFAEKLRKLILDNKSRINNLEELLLLMAARSNHINEVIIPNLKKGKIVISDRYADSSFVYQGYVNKFGIKKVQKLHKDLLNNFFPDYTFIFQINPKEIIKRLKQRKVKNKYDKSNLLFHQTVIQGYKKIANSKRYIMVDASLSKDIIHKNIIKKLNL